MAEKSNQVDAGRLNVRPDCAWRDGGQAEGGGVLGDLLTLDQGYLPAGGLAGAAAQPAKEARVACDTVAFEYLDALNRFQKPPELYPLARQRGHVAKRGRGGCGLHSVYGMNLTQRRQGANMQERLKTVRE